MNLKQIVQVANEYGDDHVKQTFAQLGFTTIGQVSDGYHTFDELYYHRMVLFAIICNQNAHKAWKSKQHSEGDDPMYENYFIVGISTPVGDYSYHYHSDFWDFFNVKELDRAPKWDGHKPEDIKRLFALPKNLHLMNGKNSWID